MEPGQLTPTLVTVSPATHIQDVQSDVAAERTVGHDTNKPRQIPNQQLYPPIGALVSYYLHIISSFQTLTLLTRALRLQTCLS